MSSKYARTTLPADYELLRTIDLAKNKKESMIVNTLSLVLLAVVFALGFLLFPDTGAGEEAYQPVMIAALFAFIVYIILHEAVHGVFMWYFSKQKPHFGFKLQYAYAGSEAYFCRTPYLVIALAPFVVWGLVFGVIALLLDNAWVWLFWFLEAANASGAAGDLYVFCTVSRMPKDVLVQDDGISMRIFAPGASKEA